MWEAYSQAKDEDSATRSVDLQPVAAAVPLHGCGEVPAAHVNSVVAAEPFLVAGHNDLVFSGLVNANSVVGKGFRVVD